MLSGEADSVAFFDRQYRPLLEKRLYRLGYLEIFIQIPQNL
jgi:hypothetical protein